MSIAMTPVSGAIYRCAWLRPVQLLLERRLQLEFYSFQQRAGFGLTEERRATGRAAMHW